MKELWEERKIIDDLAKTAKEGDTYLGDSGYWKFQNGKWVTQWIREQGRIVHGEEYERNDNSWEGNYSLSKEQGNYE
jgi:hypothetical protein